MSMPSSYQIMISEDQRRLIVQAIEDVLANRRAGTDADELELLVQMLNDLPTQERHNPGVLHGLHL